MSKQELRSIRSLEKQIEKHERKIADFEKNPTVRPGMEGQPTEVIAAQQQQRVNDLKNEIQKNFVNKINQIKGE
ncbi:MAG: hypothetical protein ACXW3B_13985 [Telluria sp.]